MKCNIRQENEKDYTGIDNVNFLAFNQKSEGVLVRKMRLKKGFIAELSIVAEKENEVVGHVLFTLIKIKNKNKNKEYDSLALAPMAVKPVYQNMGIGKMLMKYGLNKAKEAGFKSVIVLGHKEYYTKFGFQRASTWNVKCQFEVPDEAFMAIELVENGLQNVEGVVEYPEEFFEL